MIKWRRWTLFIVLVALAGCGSSPHHQVTVHKPALPAGALSGHNISQGRGPKLVTAPNSVSRRLRVGAAPPGVNPLPSGPSNASSFHVVYADNFAAALGTVDNTIKLHEHANGCCSNGNEIMSELAKLVRQTVNGLELPCKHETSPSGKPYSCSGVETSAFRWKPGGTQTFAFELVAQIPSNAGEGQDPGWWSTDNSWTDEIDFFEDWGWGHSEYFSGEPCWLPKAGGGSDTCHERYKLVQELNHPESRFVRYTTVVQGTTATAYVDGVKQGSITVSGLNTPMMHLILTHAMRQASTSGESVFTIRSVAVYENGTGNIEGEPKVAGQPAGTAPGTTLAGSEPTPPPTTETTPPPPPPPSEKPAAPTGCKAEAHDEGTTAWISISAQPSAGATNYVLWRLPQKKELAESAPWPTGPVSTPTFTNRLEVTQGHRYAYWIAAENAAGKSGTCFAGVFKA